MWCQTMNMLKACLPVTFYIRNFIMGARRRSKLLRGKGNNIAWFDFMISKFQHRMEEGPNNKTFIEIEEFGNRATHFDKQQVEQC